MTREVVRRGRVSRVGPLKRRGAESSWRGEVEGAVRGADDAGGRERRPCLQGRSLEAERRVVFVAVEVELGQRRAGGQLGALEVRRVVVAAERERPFLVDLGPPARADEVLPGDAALDGPALV